MRKIAKRLKLFYYNRLFTADLLSVFIHPSFFIRRSLYKGIRFYTPKCNGVVLDLGCGKKPYKHLFTNASEYIGVDINHPFNKDNDVDIFYDGKHIPVASASIDCIFITEVVQLIASPDDMFKEISRVLKCNGKVLLTTPFVWEEHWGELDFCRYTSKGIQHIFERNGFQILANKKLANYFATSWQMLIFYIYQNLFPANKIIKLVLTLIIIFPLNIIGIILDFLLPNKEHLFYHNTIILAEKR